MSDLEYSVKSFDNTKLCLVKSGGVDKGQEISKAKSERNSFKTFT
jgi:hypothetical protein